MTEERTRKSASPHRNGQKRAVPEPSARPRPARQPQRSGEESRERRIARARAQRLKKLRRKRIRNTLLLLLLLCCVGFGGGYFIYHTLGNSFETTNQPYQISREFANVLTRKEDLRAVPFAEDLCVIDKNVELATSSLSTDQAGLLLDVNNKRVLFSQGAYKRVYPASITKIMTAILALQYGSLDEMVTVSQQAVTLEEASQVCGFRAGDRLSMDQLLHCMLVYSGNDAAGAIAEHVGGTMENFVVMMNNYAATLGCTGTHFTNPHGLPDDDHYTTAYDIYLILREALKYPEFTQITQLSEYTVNYNRADGTPVSTKLEATDHYLTGEATPPKDVVVLGGKTGTTSKAGNCLALLSQNVYGMPFVSVVMGADEKDVLYQQMNSLLQNINNM